MKTNSLETREMKCEIRLMDEELRRHDNMGLLQLKMEKRIELQ